MKRPIDEPGPVPAILHFLLARTIEDKGVVERQREVAREGGESADAREYLDHFNLRRASAAVEAQLGTMMLHRPDRTGVCRECGDRSERRGVGPAYPCPTLLRLTWQFEHHPDCDDDWVRRAPPL